MCRNYGTFLGNINALFVRVSLHILERVANGSESILRTKNAMSFTMESTGID